MASTGYSSIMLGARSGGTVTPRSLLDLTRRSPTGSPPSSRRSRISILAPISRKVSMNPVLVGFISTPSMTMSERGQINAAAMAKAAELGSPGTVRSAP